MVTTQAPIKEVATRTAASAVSLVPAERGLTPADWQFVKEQAQIFIASGLLPAKIKSPEAAIVIMIKGREIGIPAMEALGNIHVIEGKPVCDASLMAALVYRDHGDDALLFEEVTAQRCTISYRRRGWAPGVRRTFSFTIKDADTAGLLDKKNWKNYPQLMLKARCTSAVARIGFPDSIAGMYLPEEVGATVEIRDGMQVPVDEPAQGTAAGMAAAIESATAFDDPYEHPTFKAIAAYVHEHVVGMVGGIDEVTDGPSFNKVAVWLGLEPIRLRREATGAKFADVYERLKEHVGVKPSPSVLDGELVPDEQSGLPGAGSAVAAHFSTRLDNAAQNWTAEQKRDHLPIVRDEIREAFDMDALTRDDHDTLQQRAAGMLAALTDF